MSLRLTTPAASDPVLVTTAKTHLRVEFDDPANDDLILSLIQSATKLIEDAYWISLITSEWEWRLDRFPCEMFVPRGPVQAAAITYVDDAGNVQTLATDQYQVDTASRPGRIVPAYAGYWPSTKCGELGAVRIALTLGYGDGPDDIPNPIRQAILCTVASLYENRGTCDGGLPEIVKLLMAPYRMTFARNTVEAC